MNYLFKKIKKIIFNLIVIFVFASVTRIVAQNNFIKSNQEITTSTISHNKKQIAYTTSKYLYLIDVQSFKKVDSLLLKNKPNFTITSLDFVNDKSEIVLAKYNELSSYGLVDVRMPFFEYPQDSIVVYKFKEKQIQPKRFPGNSHWSFANDSINNFVFGYNDYYEYKDDYGNINKSSRAGELFYKDKVVAPSTGIIQKIKISPTNKEVAIVYYNTYKDNKPQYTLELRNLSDLSIKNSVLFFGKVTQIHFSEDGNYIVLVKSDDLIKLNITESIQIYSTKDLSELINIPSDLRIDGLIENQKTWKFEKGELIEYDINKQKTTTNIWPNLTPLNSIEGFYKINENEIIIYGNGNPNINKKNGFFKYSLKDNAVFSEINNKGFSIDTLFNPNIIKIQNNRFTKGKIKINTEKKYLYSYINNNLQIWSIPDKRKIHDFTFNDEIKVFPSHNGLTVLIFEKLNHKNGDEFSIKLLNLEKGTFTKLEYLEVSYDFFDPFSRNANCFQNSSQPNQWICINDSKLWELDTETLGLKENGNFANSDFKSTDIRNAGLLPNSNKIIFNSFSEDYDTTTATVTKSKINSITTFDFITKDKNEIKGLEKTKDFTPFSSEELLYEENNELKLFNINTSKSQRLDALNNNKLKDLIVDKDFSYLFLQTKDSIKVVCYDTKSKFVNREFNLPFYSDNFFIINDGVGYVNNEIIFMFYPKLNQTLNWYIDKEVFTQKEKMAITDNYIYFNNKWLINLETLEIESDISFGPQLLKNKKEKEFLKIDNHNYIPYDSAETKIHFQFSLSKFKEIEKSYWTSQKFYYREYSDVPNEIIESEDGKYCIVYNSLSMFKSKRFYVIDILNKKAIEKKIDKEILSLNFIPNTNQIQVSYKIDDLKFKNKNYDILNDVMSKEYEENYDQLVSGLSFYIDRQNVIFKNNSTNESKLYFAREYLSVAKHIDDKKIIVAGSDFGNLFIWKEDNQSPFKKINLGNDKVLKIERSNDKLFVLLKNSEIKIVDLNTLEFLVTLAFFQKNESQSSDKNTISLGWIAADGYFKASKNDLRNFHFVNGLKTAPVLSYELFMNRPDLIMRKLGFASVSQIEKFEKAYLKRLERSGVKNEKDYLKRNKPEIELLNRAKLSEISENDTVALEVNTISNFNEINELKVFVNGVPLSTNGNTKPISKVNSIIVPLHNGKNEISVIAKTKDNIESEPEIFITNYIGVQKPSKVYYVGIGVSKYTDTIMNLKYADEDVKSLSEFFKNQFKDRLQIDTLTNENVVKNQIKNLKSILEKTTVDDIVIVSFSGHGLVDKDYNFYFATSDIDFNNPKDKGFSYDDIKNLLSNIPARRRLLLLDACHSGEFDKGEDLKQTEITNKNVTTFTPKGSIGISSKDNENNTFEVMQSLFYEINRGDGSFIISASGGKEFAFENDKFKNGVFTYSFINAMYKLDNDGDIKISKLKDEIYKSVKELTNGQQKPTSRTENVEWDWSFK